MGKQSLSDNEKEQWNNKIMNGTPQNEQAQQRFNGLVETLAQSRGIQVDQLPKLTTWLDVIEYDERRL